MDSWLTNGSEKEVNLEVRTRIESGANIELDNTLPLLQGLF